MAGWASHDILTLLQFPGIGPKTALRILEQRKSFAEIGESPIVGVPQRVLDALRSANAAAKANDAARRIAERCYQHGIEIVPLGGEGYPPLLAKIEDAPPVLFVRGSLGGIESSVACVGTREPSEFGRRVSLAVSQFFASQGWCVVSGLARGIDRFSHEGALHVHGRTVAVLGSGLDVVTPSEHRQLADRILERGGALVGEQPPGTLPSAATLIQRDRIQSGLSRGTIVFQAGLKSGTIHTVRFTVLQRRVLGAPVPTGGHAEHPKSVVPLLLTGSGGREIAERLGARGEYARILTAMDTDPVAFAIRSRDDLPRLLAHLGREGRGVEGA